MSKIVIGLAFDTMQEAQGFLASLPAQHAHAAFSPAPPAAAPLPPPGPVSMGAPPQPVPPAPPAPVAYAPAPPPPGPAPAFTPAPPPPGPAPAPAAPQAPGGTLADAMQAMQAYNAHYKAPGTKAAFGRFGFQPSLQTLNADQLAQITAFFRAMQPA